MSSPLRNRLVLRLGAGVLALGLLVSCQVGKLFQDGGSDPAAARLEFAAPSNATAGEPLSPAVRVSAVDSTGTVDTTFLGTVTLTLGEHPEGAALRGTRTVDAVHGVATFADLSINRAGTGYTLVATATGVRGATSPAFDVAPAAPARLAFTVQPHGAMVDSVLKPAVQVTALDTLGNVATSFAANVTVTLAANASGASLAGTTTVAAASGVATFADLSVNRAGTGYHLTASAGQLTGATSEAFDITAAPPTTGDLTVSATTTGDNAPGNFTVTVDGGSSRTFAANGPGTTYTGVSAGDHVVALTDVPGNCTASGGASKTVTVPAGGAATAAFTISCTALTGNLTVSTTTTGTNLDTDGYTYAIDGGAPQPIGINATIPLTGIPTGSHTVALAGVAANCTVTSGASKTVTVPPGGTATAAFAVSCAALTGDLAVTTSTSGANQPNAYSVTVDGGSSKSIGASDSVTYNGIAAGNHSVQLNGVPGNCSVSGLNPRMVTVQAGSTVEASFTITCSALTGTLNVTTSTSGDSPDPNGYTFTVDNGSPQSIANSQTIALTLPAGSHTVRLGDVAANCTVANGTSRTVTVPAGGAVAASFTITCQALTGSLTVTTTTTGSSLPTSDYTVTVNGTGGSSQAIHPSGTATFSGLSVGSHEVTLSGVPTNCTVSGGVSQSANITANGNAPLTFNVSCVTAPPPTGSVAVTTSTSGQSPDPDGYTVTVSGGGGSQSIGTNATVTFSGISTGDQTVTLSGVAANCTVTGAGGPSQTVTVTANQTVPATFTITCTALTGDLTVNTSTTGSSQPTSYSVSVDGGGSQTIDANGSVTFTGLTAGSHTITLSGVPSNCSVSGGASHSATVPAGGTGSTSFTIICQALTGDLTVNTATTGSSQPTSYTVSVDGGASQTINATGSVTFTGLTAGSHTVTVSGVPGNCSVSGGASHSATVPAGGTGSTSFTITCQALTGDLTVSTSTSGSGQPSGYTVSVSGGGSQSIGATDNVTFSGLSAGSHTVTLNGVPSNCSVSGGTSHSASVPAGGTGSTSFSIACTAPNQPPVVTAGGDQTVLLSVLSMTLDGASFNDPDHDAPWTVTIDWGDGQSTTYTTSNEGSISRSHSYPLTLLGHDYTLTVTVVDSHGARGSASKTVHVVVG